MAEEELEDDILDDLGDEEEDALLDEAELSAASGASQGSLMDRVRALGKGRPIVLVGGIAAGVVLLGVFILGARLLGSSDVSSAEKKVDPGTFITQVDGNQVATSRADIDRENERERKKKKKKKKKKIKYVMMFSTLTGDQSAQVVKQLTFSGIPFTTKQTGKNYSVSVDENRVSEAQNILAIQGLPAGGKKGYEILDDAQTLGVTEFDKRIRYLRALSGELEKAIIQFEMIEDAKVQIVLPEQRLFAVSQPPVTASILIRKVRDRSIDDPVVFGIIQLVANAVENLQPENVSVIDTRGIVLSEGIFERIAAGKLLDMSDSLPEVEKMASVPDEPQDVLDLDTDSIGDLGSDNVDGIDDEADLLPVGRPIVPDVEQIKSWFEIKELFEKNLAERAMKQMVGILPIGLYRVSVTSDIGGVDGDQVVEIRRLLVNVVVDSISDEVFLDDEVKDKIFRSVAGAVNYVKGRDSINLTRADFSLFTPEELAEIDALRQKSKVVSFLKTVMGLVLVAGLVVAGRFGYRKWRQRSEVVPNQVDDMFAKETPVDTELPTEQGVAELNTQLLEMAQNEAPVLAELMNEWLSEETQNGDVTPEESLELEAVT